jgi:hypothetical protein
MPDDRARTSGSQFVLNRLFAGGPVNHRWPYTSLQEITPHKSASVYECFPFTWPYNARPVLLKNSTRLRPQGQNADDPSMSLARATLWDKGDSRRCRNMHQKFSHIRTKKWVENTQFEVVLSVKRPMDGFQRIRLPAIGFVGGATTLVGIALLLYWHSDRARAWSTKTLSVFPTNTEAFGKLKTWGVSFKFVLVNNTARDFTVPISVKLSLKTSGDRRTGTIAHRSWSSRSSTRQWLGSR